jgi:CO/xanthine dehydrogenase Mo-binding subunit
MPNMYSTPLLSRRELLKSGGALVVSFAFGRVAGTAASFQTPSDSTASKSLDPQQVDSFLAIHADGSVTIFTSKVDVGTGMRIAIAQMAAEELGVSVERMRVVDGDTALSPDQGGTGGSTGLIRGGTEIRQAAATARQALISLAAERLGRPAAELTIANGEVSPRSGGAGISVAALVGDRRLSLKTDPKAPLKSPSEYSVVGKPRVRPDVPAKCTGQHTYLQDFTLPNMAHGRVVRPPAFGARLLSVDEASIRDIPARVVRIENFLAVVADNEWAAVRAARSLKATWSEWEGLPGHEALEAYVRGADVDKEEVVVNRGDVSAVMSGAARTLSATYYWPCQSHGSLAPSCSVADVQRDRATVWTSSQGSHGLRSNLARIFGFPEEAVRVVYLDGSGSYGGNGADDAAADAFLLSKTVGRPVRVQWMRQDELGWDPKGPQQLLDVRAALDSDGRVVAWQNEMWVPTTRPGARPLVGIDAAGLTQPHGQGAGSLAQNGDPSYEVPNAKVFVHWLKDTPLRPSNLRAPGKIANVFAVESFTDELAASAVVDPIAFRMRAMKDPRAIDVVKRVAEMIKWEPRPSPNPRASEGDWLVGRGMAFMRYKQAENYVAMAMEVAVNRSTGRIAVRRIVCAHDCGLVVNPDGLRNQVEGCIVQTLSRTLHEEVTFNRSRVTSVDWATYPILRMPEAPAVEVALVDHPEVPLVGAGVAATAPVAAALGNAVFDATGTRLRRVPFTPERVKAALTRT